MSKRVQSDTGRDQAVQEDNAEAEQNRRETATAVTFFLNFGCINPLSIAAIEIQATIYLRYNIIIPPERLHHLSLALVELNMDRYLKLCARLRLRLIQRGGRSITVNASIPALTAFVMHDHQFAAALEHFVFLYAFGK